MKRKFLAAAVAVAPLMAVGEPALAQVTISSATTTPVATATANNGQPADVTIAVGGSIGIATDTAPALTLNSNNSATNLGELGATGVNGAVDFDIVGGFTGTATNTGTIDNIETYTPPTDPNNNGLYTGAFALGSDRIGLEVTGTSAFNGQIINDGPITVDGNTSEGVSIQAPVTGSFMSVVVTPASGSTAATITAGSIAITGQSSVGFQITSAGSVGGNIRLTAVSATGPASSAIQLDGAVGGSVNISGGVTSTGYRTTTRQTNPLLSEIYTEQEMQQNSPAMMVGANVGGGLIISSPPVIPSTTNLDLDNDGVPDSLQGEGSVISYGEAPALQIGAGGKNIAIGSFTGTGTGGPATGQVNYISPFNAHPPTETFGLVNQGIISGQSLFDPLTSPFLLSDNAQNVLSATAIQIGGTLLISPTIYNYTTNYQIDSTNPVLDPAVYLTSGQVNITGGFYNSGSVTAFSYQGDATGVHLGAGANLPTIYNDGEIYASSTQVNSATIATINGNGYPNTPAPVAVNVTAIQIDSGAGLSSITNNAGILAQLSGTGGVGGRVIGIVDYSGTLQTINNSGSIIAELNQTLTSSPMPTVGLDGYSNTIAINMCGVLGQACTSTLPETINQTAFALPSTVSAPVAYSAASAYVIGNVVSYLGNYYINVVAAGAGLDPVDDPSYWREIGVVAPSIVGDIYMGSGNDTLNVQAGTVVSGTIAMGGGVNTVDVQGIVTSTATTPTIVAGNLTEQAGGTFAISVNNGTLIDTNPSHVNTTSLQVGDGGTLEVAVDPAHNTNATFELGATGKASFSGTGQLGLNMVSLQVAAVQTYTVVKGVQGSISAPSIGATSLGFTPYLYTASASYVASDPANGGDSEINLTVDRKTAQQLGFNAAEASAYNAVLDTLQTPTVQNTPIQQALVGQTTEAGLKAVYDQLLPNQGQGIFQALDIATQKISELTSTPPDNAQHFGGSSLWLQQINTEVDRSGLDTLASQTQLIGIVGGYERMGSGGGAMGVTLGYLNGDENSSASQIGSRDVASLVEASVYYRRSWGNLTIAGRVGGGYGWFSEERLFTYLTNVEQAQGSWNGAFVDGHLGAAYEVKLFGPYYARPEVSIDYLALHQNGYQETGPNGAFNLAVAAGTDNQFTTQAVMVLGRQWGQAVWFRTEVRMGYRQVIDGEVGDTTASFLGGTPFTLAGDPDRGGWATVGLSLKTGSQWSYLALEGDADFRRGEQRYDIRVAGRSVF